MQESEARGLLTADPDRVALFQSLIRKIGPIPDPFAQELSIKYVLAILDIVRESRGEEAVTGLIEEVWHEHLRSSAISRERLLSHLRDEHSWVQGDFVSAFMFRGYVLEGREDFFERVGFRTVSDRRYLATTLVAPIGLRWLYRHVTEVGANLSKTVVMRFDDERSRPGEAVITAKEEEWARNRLVILYSPHEAEVSRMWCQFAQGGLAAAPLLFGRPPAAVTHTKCVADGASECEYVIEWTRESLWARISAALLNLSKRHRALLARLGQLEVVIRNRTVALEEAHLRSLRQARDIAEARAQLAMGRTYAASAAHDINNALAPARSGVEEILGVFRDAEKLPDGPDTADEVVEAAFARQLGTTVDEKLEEVVGAFEGVMEHLSKKDAESLLTTLEYLERLAATVRSGVFDIYRGINRASDFTAFMSDVAKSDFADEKSPVQLDLLLEKLVNKYRGLWQNQQIELVLRTAGDMTIMGWPRMFESVFSNLLDNAASAVAGETMKEVHIDLAREAGTCVATVTDTGAGVPPELREKVFQMGFTTRPAKGKGFGLGYVRNYMLLLGGTIEVESPPGYGALFRLRFPIAAERSA